MEIVEVFLAVVFVMDSRNLYYRREWENSECEFQKVWIVIKILFAILFAKCIDYRCMCAVT